MEMRTPVPHVHEAKMDIVRHLTSGTVLEDEEDWEFDWMQALATPEESPEEWKENNGSIRIYTEAIGHLYTACEAANICALETVTAAVLLAIRGVGALAVVAAPTKPRCRVGSGGEADHLDAVKLAAKVVTKEA